MTEGEKVVSDEVLSQKRPSFEEIYSKYKSRLYLVLLSHSDLNEAEDITSETIEKGLRGFKRYVYPTDSSETPYYWLIRIGQNTIMDRNRHQKIAARLGLVPNMAIEKVYYEDPNLLKVEETEAIDEILRNLSPKQAQAFKLKYQDGLTLKEIAEYENTTEDAVKALLNRGRRKLRQIVPAL